MKLITAQTRCANKHHNLILTSRCYGWVSFYPLLLAVQQSSSCSSRVGTHSELMDQPIVSLTMDAFITPLLDFENKFKTFCGLAGGLWWACCMYLSSSLKWFYLKTYYILPSTCQTQVFSYSRFLYFVICFTLFIFFSPMMIWLRHLTFLTSVLCFCKLRG